MAQSETILIKDLPGDLLTAVGATVPRAKSPVAAEVAREKAEAVGEGKGTADESGPLLGAPEENVFDTAYRQLRRESGKNILEHAERELIERALQEMEGKQAKAAEILGITRATLRKRMDRYDLGT